MVRETMVNFHGIEIRTPITFNKHIQDFFGGFRHINLSWLLITLVGMITLKQIQVNHQNYRGAKTETMLTMNLLGGQVPTYKGRIIPTIQDFSLQIKGVGWDS